MQKVETGRSTVYLVEESELSSLKKFGRQYRACCPVHNSRDRDLVLVPYNASGYLSEEDEQRAGIGHCKSIKCGAIVRVIEWNPDVAARLLGHKVKAGMPRHSINSQDEDQALEWQTRELAALNKVHDTAVSALHHPRAHAYLAQRGLGSDEALSLLERLGVGYIPEASEWKKTPPNELKKWCDRIIFPFTSRQGERGYIGRTLMLWTIDMDENEHKCMLNEHDTAMEEEHGNDAAKYQIRRWRKTYQGGFFNAPALAEHRHVIITEGTFDALALMLVGLVNVIAIAGISIDIEWISREKKLMDVTLALDADTAGQKNTELIMDRINGTGTTAHACITPNDGMGKDWSERYKRSGKEGLAPVINLLLPSPDDELIGSRDLQPATKPEPVISLAPVNQKQAKTSKNKYEIDSTGQVSSTVESVDGGENPVKPRQTPSKNIPEQVSSSIDLTLAPLPDPDAPDALPALADGCTTCGGEVEIYSAEGLPYCASHLSPQISNPLDNLVQAVSKQFNASVIEIIPTSDVSKRKTEIPREIRSQMVNHSLKRGRVQQRMVDQWIEQGEDYTGLDEQKGDYYTVSNLEKTGFREQMIESNKRIIKLLASLPHLSRKQEQANV